LDAKTPELLSKMAPRSGRDRQFGTSSGRPDSRSVRFRRRMFGGSNDIVEPFQLSLLFHRYVASAKPLTRLALNLLKGGGDRSNAPAPQGDRSASGGMDCGTHRSLHHRWGGARRCPWKHGCTSGGPSGLGDERAAARRRLRRVETTANQAATRSPRRRRA
jgi:hypothetical protein